MSNRILIVDDEPDLVRALEYSLRQAGFHTTSAHTGADAISAATTPPLPDLVLLDLMLPDMSGKDVCRRLGAYKVASSIPVVIVTAKGDDVDRVVGLELGADDYVVKPFLTRELILRIRAILRRTQASRVREDDGRFRAWGRLRADLEAYRAWVDDSEVDLTAREFLLLRALTNRIGRVLSRDQLLDQVWDEPFAVHTRTVDTVVRRLRHKLGPAGEYIHTVRGIGYRFAFE